MKNLKVTAKLILGFTIVIFLTVSVGIAGIYGMKSMDKAANEMYEKQATPLGDLLTATDMFQRLRVQVRNAIIYTGNDEQLKTVTNDMNDRITRFEAAMQAYKPSLASEKGRQLYEAIYGNYYNTFKPGILQVLEDAKLGKSQEELLTEMAATTEAANIIASDLLDLGTARFGVMEAADKANSRTGNILLFIIIAIILVAVAASLFIETSVSRSIRIPLAVLTKFMEKAGTTGNIKMSQEDIKNIEEYSQNKDEIGECIGSTSLFMSHMTNISNTLEKVADGDLTAYVELLSYEDSMGNSLTKMIENLNSMFNSIKAASAQVSLGSTQMSDGAQLLASGSTEQAATMQQLSSSISEISRKTRDNADMANNAAELANSIMRNAEASNVQMSHMKDAVNDMNQANKSISQVIKVIDDIAFQTNILALNAAVEAARAGQHGKGFAVVAEEVRNLAAKSAESAKNTSDLISNSMVKANSGTKIAAETALSLEKIVAEINESNKINAQIASSSEEQSLAIEQINTAISGIAQVVSQNSATAEESAASSEEMNSQATILDRLISQFKLKNVGVQL